MRIQNLFSKDVASRLPLIHPPEPNKTLLVNDPTDSIYIGKSRFLKVPFFWDHRRLINPHIGIVGITGSGKSYLVKTFITRASLIWNTNAVILDWVGEYSTWVKQAGGHIIDLSKEKLNILDLSGIGVDQRVRQIMSAFDLLLNLSSYPNARYDVEDALDAVYELKKAPTIEDVFNYLKKNKKHKAEHIIHGLLKSGSNFFSGKSSISIDKIITSGLVSIDLHNLPTEELRSLAGLTILQYIKETMRRRGAKNKRDIDLFVVLDEAWKIANDERSDVITIVREGRKYNFGLIIASQNPTDMHKTIFSNIGTLFILRLVLKEYRSYVKSSLGYNKFIDEEISKFGVGDAAVNTIFSERQSRVMTFLMDKIDGEEPLFIYTVKGVTMKIEVERDQFVNTLYELGLEESQINIVKSTFEKYDGILDVDKLIDLLYKFGFSKTAIISFLRRLGVNEIELVKVFSLVSLKKAGKGIVGVELEEEVASVKSEKLSNMTINKKRIASVKKKTTQKKTTQKKTTQKKTTQKKTTQKKTTQKKTTQKKTTQKNTQKKNAKKKK